MNDIQKQLYEMFKDVKDILEKYQIPYFFHYGTAIGTIRHSGFIPWDDDIDLIIWEKDLQKVNRVLSEEIDSEKYYYHIPSADTHPHVILKTEHFKQDLKNKKAPFIDIFVMENYPVKKLKQKQTNMCVWLSVASVIAINHIPFLSIHKFLSRIPRWFERRAKKISENETTLCTVYSTTFKDEIFPQTYFDKTYPHKFEDLSVPLPIGIDKALTSLFGDYMTPPPEDKRHGANGYPCSAYKDYLWHLQKTNKNQ